jgi:alkylated DNA repair dioxygenase AlkB
MSQLASPPPSSPPPPPSQTWTFTFSESVENHRGMQLIGKTVQQGFTIEELSAAKTFAESKGLTVELIDLQTAPALSAAHQTTQNKAWILVIRNALHLLLPDAATRTALDVEIKKQKPDTQAFMYGEVKDKKARHNLCFADFAQTADFANKKGTIIDFKTVPCLAAIRAALPSILGQRATGLLAELNHYYDTRKCGIGWHGDTERRMVVGLRLGASMNLHYCWFHQSTPVSQPLVLNLHHGDLYVMSDKAVGFDWKRPTLVTLRHSAGSVLYTKLPTKKKKRKEKATNDDDVRPAVKKAKHTSSSPSSSSSTVSDK